MSFGPSWGPRRKRGSGRASDMPEVAQHCVAEVGLGPSPSGSASPTGPGSSGASERLAHGAGTARCFPTHPPIANLGTIKLPTPGTSLPDKNAAMGTVRVPVGLTCHPPSPAPTLCFLDEIFVTLQTWQRPQPRGLRQDVLFQLRCLVSSQRHFTKEVAPRPTQRGLPSTQQQSSREAPSL